MRFKTVILLFPLMAMAQTPSPTKNVDEIIPIAYQNMRQCFPKYFKDPRIAKIENLTELKTEIDLELNPKKKFLKSRVVSFKIAGQKKRLRLDAVQINRQWKQKLELVSFNEKDEPEFVDLPKEQIWSPSDKVLQSYLQGSEILSDESSYNENTRNGIEISSKIQGRQVTELELRQASSKQSLFCSQAKGRTLKCICSRIK